MKKFIIALALGASALGSVPATAQDRGDYRRDVREAQRDYRENTRDERQDYRRDVREARRDNWRDYRRYDWNRNEPNTNGYYADRYYRDGRYYRPYRLSRNDRIYRGGNGQYYCRRSDGTTGLIVGAGVGALIGNSVDRGRSSILGTLIGGGIGAALGSSIDRGQVVCR